MRMITAGLILMVMIVSHICCDHRYVDPLEKVQVGQMDDYYFENDIEINSISEAMTWVKNNVVYKDEQTDYWQLPEETYKLGTGDCEDFVIMFMFLLKTKLDITVDMAMIRNGASGDSHVLAYPVVMGDPELVYYYEVLNDFLSERLLSGWYLHHRVPYSEVMWMTYYYHDNVGQYY